MGSGRTPLEGFQSVWAEREHSHNDPAASATSHAHMRVLGSAAWASRWPSARRHSFQFRICGIREATRLRFWVITSCVKSHAFLQIHRYPSSESLHRKKKSKK